MTKQPIPPHVKDHLFHFRRWANALRGYYGVPVYLVGSALSGNNAKPRDWDIRIELSDEDFARRFGDPQAWETEGGTGKWTDIRWRWSDECVKRTKDGWRMTGLNIDFQIYPRSHVKLMYPRSLPRLRLDTRRG